MEQVKSLHPYGIRAKVLLSSVFGPYAQDDEFGSRRINPMELYQNQVTRVQGAFSLRMFHRSFGLMMIQANLKAPCYLLDFPSRERFIAEITSNTYDIIGISGILPNIGKVKEMCRLVRRHQPRAVIVVGGHIAAMPDIDKRLDTDHIVRGDGIRWFRKYLGQNLEEAISHPATTSANGTRIVGRTLSEKPGEVAAILIPSVGCPVGCNFCSTSALFGGKGKFVNFYETGQELFKVMCDLEKKLQVRSFFVLDENFLLHKKRAVSLLKLMQEHNKSWALSVFSSARVIQSYTIEELVGLGIGWVWMGLEGKSSRYRKLNDIDTFELVKNLQDNGIRVLGSSIIGLEEHSPENISEIIDYAVSHNTDFHQFMLYSPNPGTPLYEEHKQNGTMYSETEFPLADAHGQYRFSYRHQHIKNGQEEDFLLEAFSRDFEVNGPSLFRLIRTLLNGWQKYKNHPDPRIRDRHNWEINPVRSTYAGAIWGMRKHYLHQNRAMADKMGTLLQDIYSEFGWRSRLAARVIGEVAYHSIKKEEQRLAQGWSYEPPHFFEKNVAAMALEQTRTPAFRIKFSADILERVVAPVPVFNER